MNQKQRFVSFGQQNELKNNTKTHLNQITKSVNKKYENELKSAGLFKRLYLKYKIGREINKEIFSDHKHKLY